jgi:hypothetical protein
MYRALAAGSSHTIGSSIVEITRARPRAPTGTDAPAPPQSAAAGERGAGGRVRGGGRGSGLMVGSGSVEALTAGYAGGYGAYNAYNAQYGPAYALPMDSRGCARGVCDQN